MNNFKYWGTPEIFEEGLLQQAEKIAQIPSVYGVRIMPDAHNGKGCMIGSVIATTTSVIPSAVGVDIGCGVNAVKTNLTLTDLPDDLTSIRNKIENTIPVGWGIRENPPSLEKMGINPDDLFITKFDIPVFEKKLPHAYQQLGTLGTGNHFIELCVNRADDSIWLTLHSGSRGIGNVIGTHYIDYTNTLESNADLGRDLGLLPESDPKFAEYRKHLDWAQRYAMKSRAVMMWEFKDILKNHYAGKKEVTFSDEINVHHNYLALEIVDGQPMWVTRKGAIRAGKGELALIPGSMGVGSYIVEGLGNPDSFYSASHGAGRRMSRRKAKSSFSIADLQAEMVGVNFDARVEVIDEIPSAYKDLNLVMNSQADLVAPVAKLDTLLCVKG